MSITSIVVSPVKLLAPNLSVETVVTLAIVNLVIGGTGNLIAIGKGVVTLGSLVVKAVWIPSKFVYQTLKAPKDVELSEDDFEKIECEVTLVKVSELSHMLINHSYDPQAFLPNHTG